MFSQNFSGEITNWPRLPCYSLKQAGFGPVELTETMRPAAGRDHRSEPVVRSGASATIGLAGKLGKLPDHRFEV
jgi:hypothetical protein